MKKNKDLEPLYYEKIAFKKWLKSDFKTLVVFDKNGGDIFQKGGNIFVPRYAKVERKNFFQQTPVNRLTTPMLVRRIAELEIELRYHAKGNEDVYQYIKNQIDDLRQKWHILP